jgi:hypothetical protein
VWDEILDALELHDSALLSGCDANGFPFNVRCVPTAETRTRRIALDIPDQAGIVPGKASLLMHSHDEELWNLAQFLVRGTLVRTAEGCYFVPASTSGSPRPSSMIEGMKNLWAMRKRANSYMRRRGIDRPKVPWDEVRTLQDRAEQWRKTRRAGVDGQ